MVNQEPIFTAADVALLTLISGCMEEENHILLGNGPLPEALNDLAERVKQAVPIKSAPVVPRTRT